MIFQNSSLRGLKEVNMEKIDRPDVPTDSSSPSQNHWTDLGEIWHTNCKELL